MMMTESMVQFPRMVKVRKRFITRSLENVEEAVRMELRRLGLETRLRPGQSVAVTAGSRGIRDIVPVMAGLVGELQRLNARPFLVPTMGFPWRRHR